MKSSGLDHRRAEGDVGDEVAVHDVDVDDGAAAALGCCDFVGKMGEIGAQNGECQFDHLMLLFGSLSVRRAEDLTWIDADDIDFSGGCGLMRRRRISGVWRDLTKAGRRPIVSSNPRC
jgi:hypothetical protein